MGPEQFHTLLINSTALTEAEGNELIALSKEFPFSQTIHNLTARAAADLGLPSKEKLLNLSAIYSTDRSALKNIMTAPRKKRIEQQNTDEPVVHCEQASETSMDELREQIINDLAALQESKRLFELTIERIEQGKPIPLPEKKMERKEVPLLSVKKEGDVLIEEIKSTKKKIKPEGIKQIEQIEIIDQFIKTQPTIARPKAIPPTAPESDLSEPSAQFGENIVSETLVEILLKQGKKEKAIEALKKLIWKFPQKKAYFAAQIDELRK